MSDDGKDQGSGASSPENDNEDTMMEEEVEGDNDSNDEEKESDNENDNDNDDDNDDDADGDNDGDGDGDGDGDDAEGDGDADGSGGNQDGKGSKGAPSPAIPQLLRPRPKLQPNADICPTFDVIPYVAAPMSTSINAITATPCMRWVFTGGQDGYIRKFDWYASINGKVPLTVAQRHPFVETVVRAGVLLSYWENEEVPDKNSLNIPDPSDEIKFSPVYSLATQSQALWLLSGLESGNINLQSVRHDEGKIIHVLRKHKSPVSVLEIIPDETAVLSGSWDKQIYDWDLHTGDISRTYADVAGQVCSISFRPQSLVPIPRDVDRLPNGVSSSHKSNLTNGTTNGVGRSPIKTEGAADGIADAPGSPDSARSFGSLFGDDDDDIKLDDDDEFSHAIANANGRQGNGVTNEMGDDDVMMSEAPENSSSANVNSNTAPNENLINSSTATVTAVETSMAETNVGDPMITDDVINHSNTDHSSSVFLAATADGNVRIFDRRQDRAVAKISPGKGTPPWCRSACWSTDGNYIYAGRRNGTVEEFSVHRGFSEPSRTLKFPQGSGAVSAVQAMPNNRNLVCASYDNLRLYDLKETSSKPSAVPFLIIAGHHGGVISHVLIDSTSRYMISTSGNRGWEGTTTEVLLGYEVIPMM